MIRASNRKAIVLKTFVLLFVMAVVLYAFSSGPPPGHTGGFGEPTCQRCHEFGPGNGSFSIMGVPAQYTPGQAYPITVQIGQVGQSRWGFQLAVRFQSDASQAGTIQVTDPTNTQILEQNGIQYIEHTSLGTRAGTPDGPVSWTFSWVAPSALAPVQFNAAGNAANNDGRPTGDFIYAAEVVTRPSPPTFCISGRVATQDGTGLGGVLITARGPSSEQDLTRPDGSYSICNLTEGVYTVQPSRDGLTFDPPLRNVAVPPNQTGINFTGFVVVPTFCLSGRVTTQDGSALGAVIVTAVGPSSGQDLTRPDGSYSICGLTAGTYIVRPSRDGFTFDPPLRNVTVPPNQTGINFTASALPVWSPWQSLGGELASAPAAASWGPNRLDVFVAGRDNSLLHAWWDGTTWNGWENLGGVVTANPTAVSWGPNRLDLFIRGVDGALWHKWWDGAAWSGWENLGGMLVSAPAVAAWGFNRLDVFIQGLDNGLWHKWWDGAAWSGWEALGGNLSSSPAAVSRALNRLDVFVRGVDGALWRKTWDGLSWGDWEYRGGAIASSPAAASWEVNRLDVFVVGSDSALYHTWWNGTSWNGLENLGGVCASAPGAVSWGVDRLDVFVLGTDNALWHRWLDRPR